MRTVVLLKPQSDGDCKAQIENLSDVELLAAMAAASSVSKGHLCAAAASRQGNAKVKTADDQCDDRPTSDTIKAGQAAWAEFYRRHVEYLYRVCCRAYAKLLDGPNGCSDLVADCFRLAFEKASGFRPDPTLDDAAQRLRVRAWLGWISRRLMQDALRARKRLAVVNMDMEFHAAVSPPQPPSNRDALLIARAREALEMLSEREQLVIRTTMQWYRPEKQHQRLPDDIARQLAETLKTTPENLRQIRSRAMKKLSRHISTLNSPAKPA